MSVLHQIYQYSSSTHFRRRLPIYDIQLIYIIWRFCSEGWEAGALHEFYKTKLKFIKEREIRDKVEKVKEMAKKHLQPPEENQAEETR